MKKTTIVMAHQENQAIAHGGRGGQGVDRQDGADGEEDEVGAAEDPLERPGRDGRPGLEAALLSRSHPPRDVPSGWKPTASYIGNPASSHGTSGSYGPPRALFRSPVIGSRSSRIRLTLLRPLGLRHARARSVLKTAIPGPRSATLLAAPGRRRPRGNRPLDPGLRRSARGALLTDVDGNVLIDFAGGIGTLNVGHANPEVVARRSRSSSSG